MRPVPRLGNAVEDKSVISMALGNLGNLANDQSEKATACGHWATARRLFAEVGIPDKVALMDKLMAAAGCPQEKNAGAPGSRSAKKNIFVRL